MRRLLLLFATAGLLGTLLPGGTSARAEIYRILEGTLSESGSGTRHPLEGSLDAFASFDGTPLVVTDFAFQAGDLGFLPSPRIQFEGRPAILFPGLFAGRIDLAGGLVAWVQIRSGGAFTGASGGEVTFRFLDFRADASAGGRAVGLLADGLHARRLHLEGTLVRVDQAFRIGPCFGVFPALPPAGGGVSVTMWEAPAPVLPVEAPAFEAVTIPECLHAIVPPDETPMGTFSLVASAARPVDIDVQPWRRRNRVWLGRPQWLPVALLGSDELDVRDVDPDSLRLGPGEAEPLAGRRGRGVWRVRANRDGHADLLALFDVRDTGIAFGDEAVCLVARTHDGDTLEGCDAIRTRPDLGSLRRRWREWRRERERDRDDD